MHILSLTFQVSLLLQCKSVCYRHFTDVYSTCGKPEVSVEAWVNYTMFEIGK